MSLTREEVLVEMEAVWQELRHELRDLDESLDWKRDARDSESWTIRDIVSHLVGTEEFNALAYLQHTLEDSDSEMRMEAGNPVRTPRRRSQSLSELVEDLSAQCQEMRRRVEEASPTQLEAKGRFVGQSGTREQTFLERAYRAFNYHMREHLEQIRNLRTEMGVSDL